MWHLSEDEQRAEIERILRAIEHWKAQPEDVKLNAFGCRSCKAHVGEPCRGRGPHAPRMDALIAAMNSAPVDGWRVDLAAGVRPMLVLEKVRRSKLYRAGKLAEMLGPR